MRGVIPAEWLRRFEREVGPVAEHFDLIAGTSTGGILAMLMAAGVSAEDAMDFYYTAGPRIFRSSLIRSLYSAGGLVHTKYTADALREELRKCIGDGLLKSALVPVMVTALTDMREAVMIKSWQAEWADLPMAVAALMTSSAQTYFPQTEIMHQGRKTGYLDGGNVRNNPSVCAMVEALRLFGRKEEILLVQLGTGQALNRKPLPNGGAALWAAEIFDCTTNGDDSYDDYTCRVLADEMPGFTYYRFDVGLASFPALDDASKATLDGLVKVAGQGITGVGFWNFLDVCGRLKR